jgi:REP element-mobilizing transposase RayT
MKIEYTTDGMEFHFVTLTSVRKKINKLFYANTKKEVKQKLISWVEKNVPDVPLWKIKIENHEIGWR